jgi:hypothetical protein
VGWAHSPPIDRQGKLRIILMCSTRTFDDKVDSQEGNSPEPSIRSLKTT